MSWKRYLSRDREGPEGALGGMLVGALILVVVTNVLARTTSVASLVWSVELVEQIFPWIVFLGAAAAFRMRREIVVESLFLLLPPRLRVLVMALALAVTCLVSATLAVTGAALVLKLAPQVTILLGISLGWKAAALPVGMSLIFVSASARLIAFVRNPQERALEISASRATGD